MCARPCLPESELKHPRVKRRSTTIPAKEAPKPASIRTKRKWKKLLDICILQIITNDPLNTLPKRHRVRINWNGADEPEGWPRGNRVKELDKADVWEYSAELVLLWLFYEGITDWTPNKLYKMRMGLMRQMSDFEKQIDNLGLEGV